MIVRRAQPDDTPAWIEFLKRVQVVSDSWEAAYLDKPRFSESLDWLLEDDGQIQGSLCGHAIYQDQGTLYSVEVFAIDPQHQGLGYGVFLISEVSRRLPPTSPLVFWTSSIKATSWYQKNNFQLADQTHLYTQQVGKREEWLLDRKKINMGHRLDAYAILCPWIAPKTPTILEDAE